jgi:hypothetical protein
MFLTIAFHTTTFPWLLDSYVTLPTGIAEFYLIYYPTDVVDLADMSWNIADVYGGASLAPFQSLPLPGSDENVDSTLYSADWSLIDSSNDVATGFPTADTAILRNVSSLQTEYWDAEWRGENMTCRTWAAQTSIGGEFGIAVLICLGLSTSQVGDRYLFAGPTLSFRDLIKKRRPSV